jgi:hypothetical protein
MRSCWLLSKLPAVEYILLQPGVPMLSTSTLRYAAVGGLGFQYASVSASISLSSNLGRQHCSCRPTSAMMANTQRSDGGSCSEP